jgi:hypothetical protein
MNVKELAMKWGPLGLVFLAAVVCVLRAKPMSHAAVATDAQMHAIFTEIAMAEPSMRRDAVKDFPTDPWSQDDAYFNLEQQRAGSIANTRKVRFSDALRAIDVGLRSHWRGADNMKKGIEPCRPRPIY